MVKGWTVEWDVEYFNQLLGAARTRKLVKLLFLAIFNLFCSFSTFFSNFTSEISKKRLKMNKKKIKAINAMDIFSVQMHFLYRFRVHEKFERLFFGGGGGGGLIYNISGGFIFRFNNLFHHSFSLNNTKFCIPLQAKQVGR